MNLLIYPGSFNPYHNAHGMVMKLAEVFVDDGSFRHIVEISDTHPTKGKVDKNDFRKRLENLTNNVSNKWAIYPSSNDTFRKKADYFYLKFCGIVKKIVFVIGGDVWQKYSEDLIKDFEGYEKSLVRFLVVCRDGNLDLPNMNHKLLHPNSFGSVPPIHNGISSSKIRNNKDEN